MGIRYKHILGRFEQYWTDIKVSSEVTAIFQKKNVKENTQNKNSAPTLWREEEKNLP